MSTPKNVFYFQGFERSRYTEELFHELVHPLEPQLPGDSYFEVFVTEVIQQGAPRYAVHVNLVLDAETVISSGSGPHESYIYPTIRKGLFSSVAKIRTLYRTRNRIRTKKRSYGYVTSCQSLGSRVAGLNQKL